MTQHIETNVALRGIIMDKMTVKWFYVLGTTISIAAAGENAHESIYEAAAKLMDIDNKMSVFKNYSEVFLINENSGMDFQRVSDETFYVIKKALDFSKLSQGSFDPTIRPVTGLWKIGTKDAVVPKGIDIKSMMELVNYKDIEICDSSKSIRLKRKNQKIDLGGIAKGFAADQVRKILLKNGISSAIIDLGGNINALGKKDNKDLWSVGIQNPLKPTGEFVGILSVSDKSVVTSGGYERFFIRNGKRYHHIIDPQTGYPCNSDLISVTVVSDNSIDGDALSTCIFVKGLEEGLKFIKNIEGTEAILITRDRKIYATKGLNNQFKVTNSEFCIEDNVTEMEGAR